MPTRRPTPARSGSTSPTELRTLLAGVDRRSIAQSARARAIVEKIRRVWRILLGWRRMKIGSFRCALDVLEKPAFGHPAWVQPHKQPFIGPLADSERWEVHLQVVRALPLFDWTPRERERALATLRRDVQHPQKEQACVGSDARLQLDPGARVSSSLNLSPVDEPPGPAWHGSMCTYSEPHASVDRTLHSRLPTTIQT